ncbi:MAG TPA: ribulose-phosphate 3-epimerase [Pirellulaceae bacterium]|nr:ribulose-phosphate 3-epimerase [Pirellulaceae bacterium]
MTRRDRLAELREAAPVVLPSLLLCDFGNLEREIRNLEAAGVRALHLDVMDGNFVPNLTYGMPIVEACRRLTELPIDVHLMISEPQKYLRQFYEAGADNLTFHVEAVADPRPILNEIHALGAGAGLALNPATPLSAVEPALDLCDVVLVMSVPAGFGGQSFHPVAIDKLRQLRQIARPDILLEVDGGISGKTIAPCAQAGAQLFAVGSAIFSHPDYGRAVSELTSLARI